MKLAHLQCQSIKFEPGDRVIVRVNHVLHRDQRQKLSRAVQQWAGRDVEVLVVELPLFDVTVEQPRRPAG